MTLALAAGSRGLWAKPSVPVSLEQGPGSPSLGQAEGFSAAAHFPPCLSPVLDPPVRDLCPQMSQGLGAQRRVPVLGVSRRPSV